MDRRVALECTTNTRDLGGLITEDGRQVRRGMLVRTDAVLAPTDADRSLLRDLGIRHAVDFRAEAEVSANGANAYDPSVRVLALPLLDEGTASVADVIVKVFREGDVTLAEELLGGGRSQEMSAVGPLRMVRRPVARESFAEVLRLLATDDGAPLAFNCTAGKDRTGVFAALVLRLLGVSEDDIVADYVLSNECRAEWNAGAYERLGAAGLDIELIRPLLEQEASAMTAMFRAIDEDFGDFEAFLREGLGLEESVLATLREKLLTD